jgi:hypothetical protein
MQLHSANDQMTARVNMAFSRPQNYDSLHRCVERIGCEIDSDGRALTCLSKAAAVGVPGPVTSAAVSVPSSELSMSSAASVRSMAFVKSSCTAESKAEGRAALKM